jgi:flavin reductase (DIM6/NTAB) family NADH-FMN oxidoreductase RutF
VSAPLDPLELRRTFGRVPAGVVVVAGLVDGAPQGLVASTFVGVSLDPPLVSFCIQWTSGTWPLLEPLPRLGVSVLGEDDEALARQVAGRGDRFAGVDVEVTGDGAVLLPGSAAWLETSVHEVVPAGDHGIVLLRTHALRAFDGIEPLVFHGSAFRTLLP